MNLGELVAKLRAAVADRKWFDVIRLSADLVKAGADLGELVFRAKGDDVTDADLDGLVAAALEAKADTVEVAADGQAIDPNTVIQLVLLVVELIKQARKKRAGG